ncbi:hypothetical protein LJC63_06005 [Ruminococcaceae bacterium OttesenSCG-928-L11]|nr:hypothetical protein [Ruminococcaceae bacterium OttesenSCG-928-L11]
MSLRWPDTVDITNKLAESLRQFADRGGRLLLEGAQALRYPELRALCGLDSTAPKEGAYQSAAYLRVEAGGLTAYSGAELVPFRGRVARVFPDTARMLATLVPSFAPLDGVGAPPERASLLTPHTDIPLCLENPVNGWMALPFSLNALLDEFGLSDLKALATALLDRVIGTPRLRVTPYPGLIVHQFAAEGGMLLHLVNGAGKRPLTTVIPLRDIHLSLSLPPEQTVTAVRELHSGRELPFRMQDGTLRLVLDSLEVWQSIWVATGPR